MEDKGIVLFAFGKRGYAFAAYNLAYSIKHLCNLNVTLVCDKHTRDRIPNVFDNIIILEAGEYKNETRVDPAKVKTNMYGYLPYKHNLYLDVDAVMTKDINPFMDKLIEQDKFYLTDVIDSGGYDDTISYSIWASNEDVWDRFELDKSATLPAVQSSWAYIRKDESSKSFFNQVKEEYDKGFSKDKLTMHWGGTLPDELFYSAVCAKNALVPKIDERPIFFGNNYSELTDREICEKYYLLAIYGNGKGRTLTKYRYCLLYTSPSPRDATLSRMPSSA